jgi:hypothetical protein
VQLQVHTDDLSQVFSYDYLRVYSGVPIGQIVFGLLVGHVYVGVVIAVAGVAYMVLALSLLGFSSVRSLGRSTYGPGRVTE